ncbi:hypothetical protein GVX82_00915 [Patescibacteria group bacterium]|jgi:hypothetical protein|nr:hypothetical protein [Patescibacteria group bacterium]
MANLKDNAHLLLLAVGVVAVWRGVWGLLDLYLTPEQPALSFVLSILIGVAILLFNDRRLNELP